mmetsp:Transcript_66690/g.124563  ORF Transcript_66690/g.124563 Transcript_66690/m.124563 type:complete len:235 (+) Transcript_66690:24-728(+)
MTWACSPDTQTGNRARCGRSVLLMASNASDLTCDLGVEDKTLAQFWYGPETLDCLCKQCMKPGVTQLALLSAPSIFFALAAEERGRATLFEFDRRWESESNFVFFDYRAGPEAIPDSLAGRFDFILADPPNLQMSTLELYADVIEKLKQQDAAILFVTSADWRGYLFDRLGLVETKFRPSMPSSAWSQCGKFALFSSYADPALAATNAEAPAEDSDAGDEDYTGYFLGMPAHEL